MAQTLQPTAFPPHIILFALLFFIILIECRWFADVIAIWIFVNYIQIGLIHLNKLSFSAHKKMELVNF